MVASANTRLRLETVKLTALFGQHRAVRDVSLLFPANTVTAIIGPSGCGKSTMLRCLNRMHELTPGANATGEVLLDNVNIYGSGINPVELRRRIGMVFQRPTPFPTM
jgi:phosphate transport system ATP-binding protein